MKGDPLLEPALEDTMKMQSSLSSHTEIPMDQLLERCLCSNQDLLWTEFIRRSHPIIAGTIFKTALRWNKSNHGLIDDLVQETYMKLCLNDFRALRQFIFHHENSVYGFLKVVASNVVRDHFRAISSGIRGGGADHIPLECVLATANAGNSQRSSEQQTLLESIDKCLRTSADRFSSARDQVIFWLYYREGLSAREISQLPWTKLSAKGVESVICRLVLLVKQKLRSPGKGTVGGIPRTA